MLSFFASTSIVVRVIITTLCASTLWHVKIYAQINEQSRIDKAIQTVKELCLVGKEYSLFVDVRGNIVIKSLKPGIGGTAAFNTNEAQGATAIYDQKLRIIADAEVRNCTKEHIPRILEATLGQKPQTPQGQQDIEPINPEKIKAIAAQDQRAIGPADPEGLRITAAALAQGGAEGFKWSATYGRDVAAGNSLIDEYNQLVQRAKSLLKSDPYIQSLQEIRKEQHPEVAARTVKRLAEELVQYLTNFEASKALAYTAAALTKGSEEGLSRKWSATNGEDVAAGITLVREYNYLVQRAKNLFRTNPSIQSFGAISEEQYPDVAARKVQRVAPTLERALASL